MAEIGCDCLRGSVPTNLNLLNLSNKLFLMVTQKDRNGVRPHYGLFTGLLQHCVDACALFCGQRMEGPAAGAGVNPAFLQDIFDRAENADPAHFFHIFIQLALICEGFLHLSVFKAFPDLEKKRSKYIYCRSDGRLGAHGKRRQKLLVSKAALNAGGEETARQNR